MKHFLKFKLLIYGVLPLSLLFIMWSVTLILSTNRLQQEVADNVITINRLNEAERSMREMNRMSIPASNDSPDLAQVHQTEWQSLLDKIQKYVKYRHRSDEPEDVELRETLDEAAPLVRRMDDIHRQLTSLASDDPGRDRLKAELTLTSNRAVDRVKNAVQLTRESLANLSEDLQTKWRYLNFLVLVSCLLSITLATILILYQRDFIKRQRVEKALREEEQRYRLLFQSNPEPILVYDSHTQHFLAVNDAAIRQYGYTPAEFAQLTLAEIAPPNASRFSAAPETQSSSPNTSIEANPLALAGEHSDDGVSRIETVVSSEDQQHRRKDGSMLDVEVTKHNLNFGGVRAELLLAHDITERRRVEQQRKQILHERAARRDAEEANRLKDEFLATLSHELRTPLTAVLGWAQMLSGGRLDASKQRDALEAIERNARTQRQLIDELLDISRIMSGKLEIDVRPIVLSQIVETATAAMRPAIEAKNLRLVTNLDARVGSIIADPYRLQQITLNLLSNAVKFTPPDGSIEVATHHVGSQVQISVTDSGQGIDPAFLPNVFERFRQADGTATRRHGGLGLGLAIVHHLVGLHGGSVKAESGGVGRGATFTVTLPLLTFVPQPHDAPMYDSREQSALPPDCAPTLENLKILVVDDEADTRTMLVVMLEQCGAHVSAVASADEALRALWEWQPAVIVSDIGLPEVDGNELMRRIRLLPAEHGGTVPAIALTAYAGIEDRGRALASGYQMHIAKPVEDAQLLRAIATLIGPSVQA